MRQGGDATIIAIGLMVKAALEAAENLKREGIDCRVLNMPTLKPIDEAAIIKRRRKRGRLLLLRSTLSTAAWVAPWPGWLTKHQPVPMEFVAIKDTYAQSGKPAELFERYGLTARDIEKAVRSAIKRK